MSAQKDQPMAEPEQKEQEDVPMASEGKQEQEQKPYGDRTFQLGDYLFKEKPVFMQDLAWKIRKACASGYGLGGSMPFAQSDEKKTAWFERHLAHLVAGMIEAE